MSGESGGILVGGMVLVATLPIIVGAAAMVGCAVGLVALAQAGIKASKDHHKQSALKVDNCSPALQKSYDRLRNTMNQQREKSEQYFQTIERSMETSAAQMREKVRTETNTEHLEAMIRSATEQSRAAIGTIRERELRQIHEAAQRETSAIMKSIQEAEQTKMDAMNWRASTAAAEAQKKVIAQDLLRDAAASVRLLQTLAASAADSKFTQKVEAVSRSYKRAASAADEGRYEAATAEAQSVITLSASAALQYEQERLEKDEYRIALSARLHGLQAEMESQAKITFEDDLFGPIEECMDDFTQGEFSKVQRQILDMLVQVDSPQGDTYSIFKMQQMLEQVENVLIPNVETVVNIGHRKLLQYYERLHALQTISNHMRQQGYTMDWAQPVGDDVTQKLVIRFRESGSGNTIAVSLDEDSSADDVGRMAMEVMFYYANGRPVTEQEKDSVRQSIMGALRREGLGGSLQCTGCVNAEASNKTLNDDGALRAQQPIKLFRAQ